VVVTVWWPREGLRQRRVVEVSLGLVNEIVAGVLSRGGVGPFPASALTLW